ncbi:MAG: type II toxin-antitoxin system RelE/ParE family toxin [Actinobacteria bacterium]|nr:type II toxin-antitoxin system RelE/ParE family toxin [Actinomycetota bacterium]
MADVRFLDAAVEDLLRLNHAIRLRVLKKLLLLEENPQAGMPLGGPLTGYRKLVLGNRDWRIVYRETHDGAVEVCEVWVVGARADDEVYQEAADRIAALPPTPATHALAEVLARLGHPTGPVAEPEPASPPDWLSARLIHTAGADPAAVAVMTLDEALDAWTQYQSGPRRPASD